MASLAEGLLTLKDFGISTFLPAALVFALVYAVLSQVKVIGENQWLNMIVSAASAMLFVTIIKAVKFTHEFVALAAIAIVVIFFFLLTSHFVGAKDIFEGKDAQKAVMAIGVAIIIAALVIVAFKRTFTGTYDKIIDALNGIWQAVTEPEVLAMIVIFVAIIVAMYVVLKKEK